MTVIYINL